MGNTIEGAAQLGDGNITLINGGIIDAIYSNALTLNVFGTGTNLATGQFLGTGSGGLLLSKGTFTNSGLIQADDGSSVTFGAGASLTNNGNYGTLTGGSYGAVSNGDGATLSVTGSAVSTLVAAIILSGAGSTIEFGGSAIESTLGSIAAGGTLSLANGRNFSAAGNRGTLTDNGVVSLSASTLAVNSLVIGTGGAVLGTGTLEASVSDSGTITASGGTLAVYFPFGELSGTGAITAVAGSIVELVGSNYVPVSEAISGAGTLELLSAEISYYALGGNDVTIATVEVDGDAEIVGFGTLSGAVIDNGYLVASGGTLVLGGALSGAGVIFVENGGVFDLAGGGTFAASISGSVIVSSALTLTADVSFGNVTETADITLASVSVTNAASYTFDIAASAGSTVTLGRSGTGSSFTNAGSLVANGAGVADIAVAFENTGTASATSGTLLIAGALSGTGSLVASSGAVVDLASGGTLTQAISGAGTLQLDSATYSIPTSDITIATVEVDAGATLSTTGTLTSALIDNGSVAVSSGTLVVSGAVSGTGSFSAGAGEVVDLTGGGHLPASISGAGTLQLDMGSYALAASDLTIGTVNVDAGAVLSGTGTLAGTVVNSGAITASGGTLLISGALSGTGTLSAASGAVLDLSSGGTLTETITGVGTVTLAGVTTLTTGASLSAADVIETANLTLASVAVTNTAGDIFDITASSGTTVTLGISGTGSKFTNAGTLVANGTGTAWIDSALVDSGTISVTAGTLLVEGALSGTGALSAGTGATAFLHDGGALTEKISGAGKLLLTGAYTLANGDVTVSTVQLAALGQLSGSGTLTGAVVDVGTLASSSGTLLVGGKVSGNGTLSAGAGTVLDLAGGGSFAGAIAGAGTVTIAGATTLTAGAKLLAAHVVETANLTLASVAVTNTAGDSFAITAGSGATVTLGVSGTGSTFTNAGSLVVNGQGTAVINAALIDTGTISISSGTLRAAGGVSGTGTLAVGSRALADIYGGGTVTETISGAGEAVLVGSFTLAGGTETVATLGVGATHALTGSGTLAGAVVDYGTIGASGGTLRIGGKVSGKGTLSAAAGSVLNLAGGGSVAGAISGAGTVTVAGATTLLAGTKLSAATVIETANLTLSGVAVTNTAGDVFDLSAASGATITLGSVGTGAFTNAGSLVAYGAGTADISAPFTNSGTVSALIGTLLFLSSIAGTGTLDLGASSTLSLALGAITGFGGSDQVFLENTTYTTYGFTNNLLTVRDGTAAVANLHISESSNAFSLVNENDGVLITFT